MKSTEANIAGQLNIDLYPQSKNSARVKVTSTRQLQATKILIGKTPEQALSIIPLLFNVCGVAQAHAALNAIEQNLNHETQPSLNIARNMLVQVENAKEHLFQLSVIWPKLFKLEIEGNNLTYLSQIISEFKSALFQEGNAFSLESTLAGHCHYTDYLIDKLEQYLQDHVFSYSTEDWLKIKNNSDLQQWAEQSNTVAAHSVNIICKRGWESQGFTDCNHLPELNKQHLLNILDSDAADQFIAQPDWHGDCYETTSLTRQAEQPIIKSLLNEFNATLLTRWVARLVELARIPQQLREQLDLLVSTSQSLNTEAAISSNPANASRENLSPGLAQIEAARGRLIHRVQLDQGLISDYRILAPTEWNFHPQGLAAKNLHSLASSTLARSHKKDKLEQLAHLMINAIDPCVGYTLRIH